jgi:hypothetical protein
MSVQKKEGEQFKEEKIPKIQKMTPPSEEHVRILHLLGCEHLVSPEYLKSLTL